MSEKDESIKDFIASRPLEEIASFAGIAPPPPRFTFHREDIDESACTQVETCERAPVMVDKRDPENVSCKPHYRDMTPNEWRDFSPIKDVPYKKAPVTASEEAFNGPDVDEELSDEEFELSDEEIDNISKR